VNPRTRLISYGSAVALIVGGLICALVVGGKAGDVIGWTALTLGLGAILLLVFYEVGLSEDRELAKEEEQRREQAAKRTPTHSEQARDRRRRRPG
jgi:predicted MFS family arabinose efflux permease